MDLKVYHEEQKQYILDAVNNIMEIARMSSGFEITIKYDAGEIPFIDYTIKRALSVPIIDVEKKG
jgi:hypothetical protein